MNGRTFYDVHMHAFNLSHPSLLSFLRRQVRDIFGRWRNVSRLRLVLIGIAVFIALLLPLILPLTVGWVVFVGLRHGRGVKAMVASWKRLRDSALNLLAVLESEVGSSFMLIENCLRGRNSLLDDEGLHIAGKTYETVVLTPLMMDFGYKAKSGQGAAPRFHYDLATGKPIVEQVIDVFNAIKSYRDTKTDADLIARFPNLGANSRRVFEIYPFLGLNPANYGLDEIEKLLEKYFSDFEDGDAKRRDKLFSKLGVFDGDIDHLGSYFFAGIKVYPPLGFDPWPEPRDGDAHKKVVRLYETCEKKGIPITSHGGKGGFVVAPKQELLAFTDMSKWTAVLGEYQRLRLCLAHLPARAGMLGYEKKRLEQLLRLVQNAENFYVDISCRATNEEYYRRLRDILDEYSGSEREKLTSRILFGTDFSVNLMGVDSYSGFINLFSETKHLTDEEKIAFCSDNPARFLFG